MDFVTEKYANLSDVYARVWEQRDRRVDGWPLMESPLPTILLCASYVFIVKVWGPRFMRDRKPYEIKPFLIIYNLAQVVFSTYIFVEVSAEVETVFENAVVVGLPIFERERLFNLGVPVCCM